MGFLSWEPVVVHEWVMRETLRLMLLYYRLFGSTNIYLLLFPMHTERLRPIFGARVVLYTESFA